MIKYCPNPYNKHNENINAQAIHHATIGMANMKVTMLNTSDNHGGAAIATYRLHRGLRSIGIESQLLVQAKNTDDYSVIGPNSKWQKRIAGIRPNLDQIPTNFYPNRNKVYFSPAWLPERLAYKAAKSRPDIVHFFWVADGFFRIESLGNFKPPIVWTLHDMWSFTGGCHYDNGCGKFKYSCGSCPVLDSKRDRDLSRRIWERKRFSWKSVPIVIVATSRWLADMARASSLFKDRRIEVIPNGIDTERYKAINKDMARSAFNLPKDKHLMLFSAFDATSDKRKGHQFLFQAIEKLSKTEWRSKIELVIIGASKPKNPIDTGMNVHYIGQLYDEISQVLLYSAADVVVAPSVQENLSNTVMESLACGTPVVAFNIGGMPDMIGHLINGYLASPFETNDLADGIVWIIENKNRHNMLSKHSREIVEKRYALKTVSNLYMDLYQDILK